MCRKPGILEEDGVSERERVEVIMNQSTFWICSIRAVLMLFVDQSKKKNEGIETT